jgi:DNA-binding LacI/PurR family transcriptional regulator
VRIPQIEMGEAAVRLAIDLQKGNRVEPRRLPVEIIVRTSTRKVATGSK